MTNEKELAFIKRIKLPYNFDKSYQFHASEIRNAGMYFSGMKVTMFEAHKLNKGARTKLKYSSSEKRIKCVLLEQDKFGTFKDVLYSSDNIAIGDTVLIDYSYTIPYSENLGVLTNYRLFFNDEIAKKNFEFSLEHDKKLNIGVSISNLAAPIKETTESDRVKYSWKREVLQGSILEKNAIPYKTEPYILISCSPNTFSYILPNSTRMFLNLYTQLQQDIERLVL